MNTLTEQLEQLAELQKKSLEPLHRFNNDALAAFERVARKNHELIGDMVDFAVAQSRSQVEGDTPQAIYARQVVEAKAFAEKVSSRAAEYAELAAELKENAMRNLPSASGLNAAPAPTARPASKRATTASVDKPSAAATGAKTATAKSANANAPVARTATAKAASTKKRTAKAVAKAAPRSSSAASSQAGSKATGKKATAQKVSSKKKSAGKRTVASRAKG